MDDAMQNLRDEIGLHYVTLRLTGGFGSRVAAALAASMALQDELRVGDARYRAAYPKIHRELAEFLQTNGEAALKAAMEK